MALGFIETRGMAGCLIASDAMCKVAAVEVTAMENRGSGYTTTIVSGTLQDVEFAVKAGIKAVSEHEGELFISNIIARPHPGTLRIIEEHTAELGDDEEATL